MRRTNVFLIYYCNSKGKYNSNGGQTGVHYFEVTKLTLLVIRQIGILCLMTEKDTRKHPRRLHDLNLIIRKRHIN
jgi:hypothetical protein